jgi:ABC-type bacteriocin/lantibiotic exporter with double-glycine peptidase domain
MPLQANLLVLEILAKAAGVPFDPSAARQALLQAEGRVLPTAGRASRQRLAMAAQVLGIQILTRQLSIREALGVVRHDLPLASFAVGSDGTAKWFVLVEARGGRGRLARLYDGDPEGFLTPEELAQRLDASSPDAVLEWCVAQPATPAVIAEQELPPPPAQEEHSRIPPFRRLLALMQPDRRDIGVVVLYALVIGILSLATPIVLMAVVNTVALATLVQQLLVLCLGLFACLIMIAVMRMLQLIVVEYIQRRIFVRVAADLSYRLPRVRLDAFDGQHGPELVNRFFDVLTVQKSSATLLLEGIDVILQTIIGLTLLAVYHWILLGFDLFLIAALIFLFWPLGWGAVSTAIRESRAKYAVAGWLEEMARHPSTFKLSGGPHFATDRTDALTREYLQARNQHFKIVFRQNVFGFFVYALATTILLAMGGYLVIYGQLTLGQLVAAEMVVSMVVISFTKLGKHLESFYDLLAGLEKLGQLIDLPLERMHGILHQAQTRGASVRIRNLSFAYDTAHRAALQHLDLAIDAGERVAILGANGSGKTTLLDLLFGLRVPSDGFIEIDGVDVRDLQLESLRQHVAVVRGIEIFEASVLDNIRMGRDELTLANIYETLEVVGLRQVVQELPQGIHTRLGTGGSPLSMGQAVRLVLARAIVGQPRLLVLDDVLDSIDRDSRREILPALMGRSARWTLIVMTHSADVAALCDRQIYLPVPGQEPEPAAVAGQDITVTQS